MNHALPRYALYCAALFCFALAALTGVHPVLAGQSVVIDTNPGKDVAGNSPKPDHTWDPDSDDPATLLSPGGNSVTINSNVDGDVYGGFASGSGSLAASGNSVTANKGRVGEDVLGGYVAEADDATANDNSVTIHGGVENGNVHGGEARGSNSATANSNRVTISGGREKDSIYGGVASGGGRATASYNTVTINNGGVAWNVYGGEAIKYRSGNDQAIANGNNVIINGGKVSHAVTGGSAAGYTHGTASGNTVTINGGTVSDAITGGRAAGDSTATATSNTVTLSGSPIFDAANTHIFGGVANSPNTKDAFTGNTLNVWNYTSGGPVPSVQNFEFYNFTFPAGQGHTPVLEAASVTLGGASGKMSVITANTFGGSPPLKPGDSVTLIAGTVDPQGESYTQATGSHGATLRYAWRLDTANGLVATLESAQAVPGTKAFAESFLADIILVDQGGDLVAGQGVSQAVNAVRPGASQVGSFGAASGGWSRYNTGSHLDMAGVSFLAGLAWGRDFAPGRLTLGAFFEYGHGSYDTHNAFSGAASVRGDGDVRLIGGGILGRMDFVPSGPGRFYAEASGRTGKLRNGYGSPALRDDMGRKADYDSSAPYYALHLGTGYIWNLTEKDSLDLYGKYFRARVEGDSVRLSTNDPVRFKETDSRRLRVGARFTRTVNAYVAPYIGVAYEHEFAGTLRAATYGHGIDSPSLKGGSGMGEIGLTFTPSQDLSLSFDLGGRGYTGVREGVAGTFQVTFAF